MKNELLWTLMLIINFLSIIFIYKQYGKIGLYIWVPISTILANIQVVLLVNLFGFNATLGNILYAGGFLVTDILGENYGKKEAKKAVYIGFFSLIIVSLIMKIAVSFTPLEVEKELFLSVKKIFDFLPRLMLASLCAYFFSQLHDIWAYEFWKKKYSKTKHIWIRNNASTIVSQLLDNFIFTFIAFYGVLPFDTMKDIFISTYILKFLVAVCDTPFVYLANYLKKQNLISEE